MADKKRADARQGRIGVIGIGLMGTAIAHRLLDHGIVPIVWNRTRDPAEPLLARGAI